MFRKYGRQKRSFAVPVWRMRLGVSGIAAPYAVAVLLNGYGVTGVFVLLGTVSIIVAIAIATIGIETKGVSVESLGIDAVTSK